MSAFLDYYRCPGDLASIATAPALSAAAGYFRFGEAVAFGRVAGGRTAEYSSDPLTDVSGAVTLDDGRPCLPFDLTDVADGRREIKTRKRVA